MSKLQRVLAIVIALYLLLVLGDRFVLVELLLRRVGYAVLLSTFEALAIIGCGFAARSALAQTWTCEEADLPRDFILGYPLFGALCFLIGLLNVSVWSMTTVLVICGVGGLYVVVRRFESRLPRLPVIDDRFVLIAIACIFLGALVAAQAPPSSLDELAYHLAVPWTWVKEHRAIALPLISHSYFPLGIESADLPLLEILGQLRGGIASHFLHLGAACAATVMFLRLARGNSIAVAAIVTTPALAVIAGWSLVDWPLIGICAVLTLALDEDDIATISIALAAGLLTKYTFIPFSLAAFGVWAWRRRKSDPDEPRTSVRYRLLLIGLAIGSIFFVRNLILTANPVAPFLSTGAPHVTSYRAPFLSDFVFDSDFLDEGLGASLLAACALSAGALSWILLAFAVGLFLVGPSTRILLPFLAIPAARSLRPSRFLRATLIVAIAVQLFLVAFYIDRTKPFSLLSGASSDEQYLAKQRASYGIAQTIDPLLPADSRALIVGMNETYWFTHKVRGGGNFDGPRISQYLDTPTPDALHARLRADGITHIAVVAPVAPTTAVPQKLSERETSLTPQAQRMLAQTLDRFASTVTSRGGATLFTLR